MFCYVLLCFILLYYIILYILLFGYLLKIFWKFNKLILINFGKKNIYILIYINLNNILLI